MRKTRGTRWIHHKDTHKNIRVFPDQVADYLKSGDWVRGQYKHSMSNNEDIIRDTI